MSFENTLLPLLIGLIFASGLMTALWQVQRKTGNAGIVDIAWAATVGWLGIFYALGPTGIARLKWLVAGMIAIWSLRLTRYLFRRVVSCAGRDPIVGWWRGAEQRGVHSHPREERFPPRGG